MVNKDKQNIYIESISLSWWSKQAIRDLYGCLSNTYFMTFERTVISY